MRNTKKAEKHIARNVSNSEKRTIAIGCQISDLTGEPNLKFNFEPRSC